MAKIADKYYKVHPFKVVEEDFDPSRARVSEAIFSLANENLGIRGYFDEGGNVDSLRGAYTNGVYEIEELDKSYVGIVDHTHFMIPTVDWAATKITLDGETLDLSASKFSGFVRTLDMQAGTLTRTFTWETQSGKTLQLTFLRFVDMLHDERAYQQIALTPIGWSGNIDIECGLDFNLIHEVKEEFFWNQLKAETTVSAASTASIQARTTTSGQEVFAVQSVNLPGAKATSGETYIGLAASVALKDGETTNIDKTVVVLFDGTTGDTLWNNGSKLIQDAANLANAQAAQAAYWAEHWAKSDITIEPASDKDAESVAEEQQGIRYCSFQMAQTYRGGNAKHNIGAKGLTGEAYNGHAFWDSETCCLPFYLFTNPDAAKSLLMFRYSTLPQAKERAKMLDCEGAAFPVATLNGEEACNLWQHASLQFQPTSAVAYGIWHYVKVTGDTQFLDDYGAELLLETARCLKSRTQQNPVTKQYGYYGVMGPDEFKMMVNNNAYTNYMGKRSLQYAAEVLSALKAGKPDVFAALVKKTSLKDDEIDGFKHVADNMFIPQTEDGLFEQNDGFFELPHIDIHAIPITEFPLYGHWSYDRIYRGDMIKQPDVLQFLYLYNSSFSEDVKRKNYDFYEPKTIHESSLSPSIHSILAAELDKMDEAVKFFGFATRLDLDNYNRNTREGLHTTSIAMAWIGIVYGFGGLRSDGDTLSLAPRLPDRWGRLKFTLTYQGRLIDVTMQKGKTIFDLQSGEPLDLIVYGKAETLNGQLTIDN